MKFRILLSTIAILFLFSQTTQAQNKFETSIFVSPLVISLSGSQLEEEGDELGNLNLVNTISQEFGIQEQYNITDKLGVGLGASWKQYKFKMNYSLLARDDFPIYSSNTDLTTSSVGLRAFVNYRINKFTVNLIYERNTIASYSGEIINEDEIRLGNRYTNNQAINLSPSDEAYSVSEQAMIGSYASFYSMPELLIQYDLSDKLTCHLGLKYKLRENTYYNLNVAQRDADGNREIYTVGLSNNFALVHLGLAYSFKY